MTFNNVYDFYKINELQIMRRFLLTALLIISYFLNGCAGQFYGGFGDDLLNQEYPEYSK